METHLRSFLGLGISVGKEIRTFLKIFPQFLHIQLSLQILRRVYDGTFHSQPMQPSNKKKKSTETNNNANAKISMAPKGHWPPSK